MSTAHTCFGVAAIAVAVPLIRGKSDSFTRQVMFPVRTRAHQNCSPKTTCTVSAGTVSRSGRASLQVLHHQPGLTFFVDAKVMDLHDARMANLVNSARLVHKPLEVTRLRLDIQSEDLQRRATQNIHLLHLVHGSYTTRTKEPNHTVFATNNVAKHAN